MDRISRALQRARQQRGGTEARFGGLSADAGVDMQATTPVKSGYTRTRVIDVDRETLARHRVVSAYDSCMFTDAFKILSIQVSHILQSNGWNTIAVTSANEHEGKTLVAVSLAISLAMEFRQTAVLVDADLRRPSVRQAFGLERGAGLSDHLVSHVPVEDLLVNPGIQGLVVLPGGRPLPDSSALMACPQMTRLVDDLKTRYRSRIVVFDLPPLLRAADVIAFAPNIEAAVLVVAEGETAGEDVTRCTELLGETRLIGTVLNKSLELRLPADKEYRMIDPPAGWRSGRSA